MPYKIRKLPGKNSYRVVNTESGKVKAYNTTKENAVKQLRLLYAIEKGGFIPNRSRKSRSRKSRSRKNTRSRKSRRNTRSRKSRKNTRSNRSPKPRKSYRR